MSAESVVTFQKDLFSMDPNEVLGHLAYLRRTIAVRDTERRGVDLASLTKEAQKALAEVAKSDHEMLATLDALEATIRAEMAG